MKKLILIFLILFTVTNFRQYINLIEKKLNNLIEKRIFWSDNNSDKANDSLFKYNSEFENFIVDFTSKNPKTLTHSFDKVKVGLNIISSQDGLFRIYNWNTFEGGTMQFYKNIFQYNIDGKIYSKLNVKNLYDNGCNFYEINDVIKNNKHYYVTSSISVGSSAVYYYQVKVFSIDKEILNENAKLIKTKSGLKNTLGYDIDLSSSSNRDRNDGIESSDFIKLIYDKKNKTILIPLINANGKITKNKIKYKFNGDFFEKI